MAPMNKILVISTVKSYMASENPGANRFTILGEKIIPKTNKKQHIMPIILSKLFANLLAARFPSETKS